MAPVASVPADTRDRVGRRGRVARAQESHGPGSGGGVGTGQGTGTGEGEGPGLGPGSGGGTGGGPYRPGSGIEAPRLLREYKPDYTEEARQRGIEGDVVMEIVVRRDGSVGDVRVLQGLGVGPRQAGRRCGAAVEVCAGQTDGRARGRAWSKWRWNSSCGRRTDVEPVMMPVTLVAVVVAMASTAMAWRLSREERGDRGADSALTAALVHARRAGAQVDQRGAHWPVAVRGEARRPRH